MRVIVLAALLAIGGCTLTRMEGFDAIAATGERIDLHGVPAWQDGSFRLGDDGTTGHVRRRARGRTATDGWGDDGKGAPIVRDTQIERYGSIRFTVAGPSAPGGLAGDCYYARSSAEQAVGAVAVEAPVAPLDYRCRFTRDGAAIGSLVLGGVGGARWTEDRIGSVSLGTTTLALRSVHHAAQGGGALEQRIGYVITAGAAPVGAVELNAGPRRLVLPRDPAQRDAALAAALALALLWDPGDTD